MVLQASPPLVLADSSTLSASQDTHLQEDDPTANFGSANDLKVRSKSGGNNRRALIEFDLSALPGGAFIESATLRVFMNNAPGVSRTYEVHRVTKNWVESQVTWNKRTGASWTTPGGDFDASIIATQTTGTTSSVWLEWDVTSLVQDWVNGTSNFGLLIKDSSESNATNYEGQFNSSEAASNQPELVVVWDTTAPSDPTNLTSTSHTTSTWSSDNTVDVTWTAATDNAGGSGVDGYSIEWSTSAGTVPDAVKDLEESATSTTSPQLADGNSHYFHIRTRDNAGNWTSTLHLGPFFIDTTAPTDPTNLTSTSHTTSVWSSDNTVDLTWTAATDGGSDIDGYSIVWDTTSNTLPNTTLELQEGATSTTSPALADGNSHYFHIRTCDNVGNCTSTLHLGPFFIDTTAPTDPTNLTSTSHTTSVWSNDNTVDLTWTAATDGGSGVDGYSIEWDTNATTVPDSALDLDEAATSDTSPALADGNSHYFHLLTCDNVGNCTSTLHLGPFFIDSPAPSDPADLTSTGHTPGVWSNDDTVDLTWSTSTDTGGSGLDGYSIVWDTNPATVPDATLDLQEDVTSTTSPGLADGDSHYFHIRTCDNAGNCTSTEHLGPFFIDTTDPFVSNRKPGPGAQGVNTCTDIVLHVKDRGAGVKKGSIVMKVNGVEVTPTITGSKEDYTLTYGACFAYGQEVKVKVKAEDRVGNDMPQEAYSFRIADNPAGDTTPTPTPTPTLTPTPTSTPADVSPSPTPTVQDPSSHGGDDCSGFWYTVQPGEWIYALARHFGVTPAEILEANNLTDPDNVQPGQELCIPGSVAETETPTPTPTATTEPTETPTPTPSPTPTLEPPVVGQTTPEPTPPNNPPSPGLGFPFGLGGLLPWLFLILGFLGGVLVTSGVYRWRARQA